MEGSGGTGGGSSGDGKRVQNVVVMRHGDRVDHFEPLWVAHAPRPWDPPLTNAGRIRAWTVGKRLRGVGFPFHRVLVSPFLRCLQTASEVVRALCAVVEDDNPLLLMENSGEAVLNPSRIKVSIEYGLCEMINSRAITASLIPSDKRWFPAISDLEALLPAGTVDHSTDRVYEKKTDGLLQLPEWQESIGGARNRYVSVIQALADKYPNENLLLVTHGEGVGVAVSSFLKDSEVYEVEYCACSHLQRQILSKPSERFNAEEFKVLTMSGQTGVSYYVTPESEKWFVTN